MWRDPELVFSKAQERCWILDAKKKMAVIVHSFEQQEKTRRDLQNNQHTERETGRNFPIDV